MSDNIIQASFNSGEWSPKLYARVDIQKYRSGAALLENFFVDYLGGASTRPGTKYVLQCFNSSADIRLIPFQASVGVGYALEFGDRYVRFYSQGAPVLEPSRPITGATRANPCVLTIPGNSYQIGDWIFVENVGGMTQLNGRYFLIANVVVNAITISDLNGVPIDSTSYGNYISGGDSSRVFTLPSPYAAADLALLKFSQNVTQLILCHHKYPPYALTIIVANNWTLLPIQFGTTAATPAVPTVTTTLAAGTVNYSYVVTAVDGNGQESSPSPAGALASVQDLRTVPGTNSIAWSAVVSAVSYNIYKSDVAYGGPVPAGLVYGFIGSTTGVTFIDSNITPDFSQTPPIDKNPFIGNGIASVQVTNPGAAYIFVPSATLSGGSPVVPGSIQPVLQAQPVTTVGVGGTGYAVDDAVNFPFGIVLIVASIGGGGVVTGWRALDVAGANPGAITSGAAPANPLLSISSSGGGSGASANINWGVGEVIVTGIGAGYVSAPVVVFSGGGATATVTLGITTNGYPSVPGFFQQRLVLAAADAGPQTFHMSQPGAYFNYNISAIAQADDSISGTLVSGQLNTIKAMVAQTSGLLMFTDRNSWLINGGSAGSAVSPAALVANAQSFNGISDVPPIIANFDVLYVQAKGSIVRDSAYNIYANVYTGTDISAIASHLFYGHTIVEWAWAEEPFKVVWAVRDDGVMLTLTFLKEQEFIGWAHSVTEGSFISVCSVIEQTATAGEIDAIYTVVERTINGHVVKYVERLAERTFPTGVADAWCVDCGISYSGAPATTFSGADFLAGATVTGLADGVVIPPFVMPTNGAFTLPTPASKVVVGLAFLPRLQTLPLEIGDPTIQGKPKKINAVDVRVADTLGLTIGSDFTHQTPMKDLIRGNVSSMLTGQSSQIVTDLVNGDARTFLDPTYTIFGQYCIEQPYPLPATVLGVIPDITIGDTSGGNPRR